MVTTPAARTVLVVFVVAGTLLAACAAEGSSPSFAPRNGRTSVLGNATDPSGSAGSRPAGSHPRTLRFAVVGDHGSGLPEQAQLAERMCSWRRNHSFRLVFTTGDNVYDNGELSRFDDTFMSPYECLLDRNVQFRSTLGNHDVRTANGNLQVAEGAFGYKHHRRNYVVRKKGVRFVVANATDLREHWLRKKTTAQRGDRWTIVIFHYPVYSSGGYETHADWRDWMPDLFAKRGVDLVLSGHDHLYSATKRLRGIRYVVTGGGGASLYACHHHWYTDSCRSRHHFLYVVATRRHLWVRAIPREHEPFDSFFTRGRGQAG
jgi:Calcineurin-like phosphoesterase